MTAESTTTPSHPVLLRTLQDVEDKFALSSLSVSSVISQMRLSAGLPVVRFPVSRTFLAFLAWGRDAYTPYVEIELKLAPAELRTMAWRCSLVSWL